MPDLDCVPTEYQIKGVKVESFLDQRFLKLLREFDPNIVVDHIVLSSIKTEEDEKISTTDRLGMGHLNREDERESILNIGSRKPQHVEILKKAIIAFNESKETC